MSNNPAAKTLGLLDLHYDSFHAIEPYATETGHPVPMDTRGWSQIIVSTLCGVPGLKRRKGADLDDGSDVKGANTWNAIDTPRFNGVLKAGTKAKTSNSMESLSGTPHLYFVLWDDTIRKTAHCRIWAGRPQADRSFRAMCKQWYQKHTIGEIISNNFQLHPPRGQDTNLIRNTFGNLYYPLYFCAERVPASTYKLISYSPNARTHEFCTKKE